MWWRWRVPRSSPVLSNDLPCTAFPGHEQPSAAARQREHTAPNPHNSVTWASVLDRGAQVERDQPQQRLIIHFSQVDFLSAHQQRVGKVLLRFEHRIDFLLDRATADELMHQYVLPLPDAESPVGCLILDRGVPPAIKMLDMRRRRQRQPGTTGL